MLIYSKSYVYGHLLHHLEVPTSASGIKMDGFRVEIAGTLNDCNPVCIFSLYLNEAVLPSSALVNLCIDSSVLLYISFN